VPSDSSSETMSPKGIGIECAENDLGMDDTDAGVLRSLRDVDHDAVVAIDQAARGRVDADHRPV
jgi:hypothetical protein